MRSFKNKAALASLIGLVALIVAACGTSSGGSSTSGGTGYDYGYKYQTPTKTGGKVVYGDWQSPDSANIISSLLDPTVVNADVLNAFWGSCIYQLPDLKLGLAGWQPDECTVVPTAANGGQSADGTTTTIHISPNAKWSDGSPMVAADFLMYYNMYVDPNIGGQNATPPWDKAKVSATDDHTLVYNWGQPFAPSLYNLLPALPSHKYPAVFNASTGKYSTTAAQALIKDPDFLNNPVVDGPFIVQSFGTGGTSVVAVPNPNYYSTTLHKSVLDKLIFQAAGSKDALIQAFKGGGQYDQVEDFTFADVPKFAGIPSNEVIQSPAYEFEHLEFNQRPQAPNAKANGGTSIFTDAGVRKAFIEGFNKCDVLVSILGVACNDPSYYTGEITSPADPAYDPSVAVAAYNQAASGADLTAAGYPLVDGVRMYKDGKTPINLALDTTGNNLIRNSTLALVQQAWSTNLGVSVTITEDTTKLFNSYTGGGELATGNFDVALFAFSSSADSDSLTQLVTTVAIPSATNQGGQNYSGVSDSTIDQLLATARQELNPATALKDYHDIYARIAQENYFYPLYARPNISLVLPTLGNYKQQATSVGNTWNVGEWFQGAQ